MTKSTESRKVRKIEEARKKRTQKARTGAWWHEVIAYHDATKIISLRQQTGYRAFLMGEVGDFKIVEVPKEMSDEQIRGLQERLGEMGVKALILSDQIRFVKLRPCSREECELLDDADKDQTGSISIGSEPPPPAGD